MCGQHVLWCVCFGGWVRSAGVAASRVQALEEVKLREMAIIDLQKRIG